MNQPALFLLDEPRPLTTRGRIAWVVVLLAFVAVTFGVVTHRDVFLTPLLWVPVAHSLALALICGFTAVLLFGQAAASGRRGYVWLASTYLYVACLLLAFPLFFPGAVREDEPLLGGAQGAITIFYLWHIAFLVGFIVATTLLWYDRHTHRRPRRARSVWWVVAANAIVAAATLALVAVESAVLPEFIVAGGISRAAVTCDWILLVLSVVALGVAAAAARHVAQIQRWLLAVSVLLIGEALVNLSSAGRWSFAWYFERVFEMAALTGLFVALMWIIAKAGQATNQLAASDQLTGAESRASFTRVLEMELAAAGNTGYSMAMLWIDIDGFKSINDQLGHAVGDEVLRTVVARVQSQVRSSDHVGRLGGDEFGVLLCEPEAAARVDAVAQRILLSLRDPIVIDGSNALLSASIGVAVSPTDADTPDELLSRADLAMYAAKNAGGDRYLRFTDDLSAEAISRAELRHSLSQALLSHQFVLEFQPIVVPGTGAIAGYETLVRWLRGDVRIVARAFIEFAEGSGQIVQIGRQVVELLEAELGSVLQSLPADGFVTFNISAKELADPVIMHRLLNGPLAGSADQLVVEITESTELFAMADAEEHIDQLRAKGYRLALDDFGAGFSNLTRLERLHPHLLKIDQSLVARAGHDEDGGVSFLQAAMSLARSLDCRVVAEGVEGQDEHDVVVRLDIPLAQGMRYGAPAPIETAH